MPAPRGKDKSEPVLTRLRERCCADLTTTATPTVTAIAAEGAPPCLLRGLGTLCFHLPASHDAYEHSHATAAPQVPPPRRACDRTRRNMQCIVQLDALLGAAVYVLPQHLALLPERRLVGS